MNVHPDTKPTAPGYGVLHATAPGNPTSPPMNTTNPQMPQGPSIVINQQQRNHAGHGGGRPSSRNWHTGVCGCLGDCNTCCCGLFCPCCLMCRNASDLGESGFLCCLLGVFLPCIPICLLRGKARQRYNIEGNCCGDLCCACFCTDCVNCQTASEIRVRGHYNGA